MVYRGRPSQGCEICRARRLKCDQKRPGCGQCRNTGRTCLGYRNANDLVFENETKRTIIKYKKTDNAKTPITPRTSPSRRNSNNGQSCCGALELSQFLELRKQLRVPPSLHQSIHDVALNFLLGDYIRGSHFKYLPSLYSRDQPKSVLCPIVKAVGLACLSIQSSRPELQNDARKFYVDAIAEINAALQRTDFARNDDLLASILLLSLYETLTLGTKLNVEAWTSHMQGALALVTLRGPCQFQSQFGLELFKQIAASIRVVCVQQIIRIPRQLRELTKIAKRHSHTTDMSFEYPCIVEAFTDLRADMMDGILTEPSDIIERAQGVLGIIEDFYIKLPHDWKYDTVHIYSLSPEIHNDYYYQFTDHYIAQIWNTTWMGKLHLNSLILEQAFRLGATSSRLQRDGTDAITFISECQKEIIEAAENICASVPQFFPPIMNSCSAGSSRIAAVGYFLIWPLFTAGSSSLIPSLARDYIIDRLLFIGRDLKLPQAYAAAEMLVHGNQQETWMHLCHSF